MGLCMEGGSLITSGKHSLCCWRRTPPVPWWRRRTCPWFVFIQLGFGAMELCPPSIHPHACTRAHHMQDGWCTHAKRAPTSVMTHTRWTPNIFSPTTMQLQTFPKDLLLLNYIEGVSLLCCYLTTERTRGTERTPPPLPRAHMRTVPSFYQRFLQSSLK